MNELKFLEAEGRRAKVNATNKRRIKSLYKQVSKDIDKELQRLQYISTMSGQIRREYLKHLKAEINVALKDVDKNLEQIILSGMRYTSHGVIKDAQKFLSEVGLKVRGAYLKVPEDIIAKISTGQVYQSDWTLSKAIWGNTKKIHDDINTVVAKGVSMNKSAYEIGKDLEKYVNPAARKDFQWGKVYPGTNKIIDYNAQRLARTLVTHAYQQSLVEVCKTNPYIKGLRWETSGGPRVCPLCEERDGKIYPVDDCPLDHPNGMCTQVAVLDRDLEDISKDLAQKVFEPLVNNSDYQAWREYLDETRLSH